MPSQRWTWLAADATGRVYAGVDARRLLGLGDTLEQALLTLCDAPGSWVRIERPEREPWPLVHSTESSVPVGGPDEAAGIVEGLTDVAALGPVLAVTDLGRVWRVFRSFRPDRPSPTPVPYLVHKSTGAVAIDWPPAPIGPTAQQTRREIERELGGLLAAHPEVTHRDRAWVRSDAVTGPAVRLRAAGDANRAVVPLHLEVSGAAGSYMVEHADTDAGPVYFAALAGVGPQAMAHVIAKALLRELHPPD